MRRRALLTASMGGNGEGPNVTPVDVNYLTIEALEDGLTVSMSLNACEYCVDGNREWRALEVGTNTISVNAGQTLSFKGRLLPDAIKGIGTFTISKKCNLKGNCMSMLFDDYAAYNDLEGKQNAFYKLFYNCSNIVNVSENFLPATTLASNCYRDMFYGCTSLQSAPKLPATTLASWCYANMFSYCTSLTTAPELPATKLVEQCYNGMFNNCRNLNYIKALFTTTPSGSYTNSWVNSVASTGTFIKNAAAAWNVTGASGIPYNWTVVNDYSQSEEINFYISNQKFNAKDGMTWKDWVNSEYNTVSAYIDGANIRIPTMSTSGVLACLDSTGDYAWSWDIIYKEGSYFLKTPDSGGADD